MKISLDKLKRGQVGLIDMVSFNSQDDQIAQRLCDIGFVANSRLTIRQYAPWTKDPILVEMGASLFALRLEEARRILIKLA